MTDRKIDEFFDYADDKARSHPVALFFLILTMVAVAAYCVVTAYG